MSGVQHLFARFRACQPCSLLYIVSAFGLSQRATERLRWAMIKSIRHKGQAMLHASGTTSGIQAAHVERLRLQLAALDTAQVVEDLNIPGFGLHPLKGGSKGRWSIRVNGNWRLTFEFKDGHVHVLDYEDHH
jgi:proteic killer suppression protein